MSVLTATGAVFARETRAKIRTPWPYVEAVADPLLLLVLFGPLVAGLGQLSGMPADTVQWFAPGILVLMAFTTSAFIGAGLQEEREAGALERMLVTPVSRFALLAGRVLRVAISVMVQAVIVVLVVLPFGLEVFPAGLLIGALLLAVVAAVIGIGSLALGLSVENAYAFWGVGAILYTPIMVTSGALLPMNLAPDWLYALSRINPLSHVVEAQRALFVGDLTTPAVILGFVVALAFGLLGTYGGIRAISRIRT
jgi:ABC-2 type transport system permease protein